MSGFLSSASGIFLALEVAVTSNFATGALTSFDFGFWWLPVGTQPLSASVALVSWQQ